MKKRLLLCVCLLTALSLFGCTAKPTEPAVDPLKIADGDAVISFTNELEPSDIWVLPQTEENLKTTLWGTATVGKLATNGTQQISLTRLGGSGAYILRVIDEDGMYYSANGLVLENGCSMRLFPDPDDPVAALLEVYDASGTLTQTISVFAAHL